MTKEEPPVEQERAGDRSLDPQTPTRDRRPVELRRVHAIAGTLPRVVALTCPACGHRLEVSATLPHSELLTAQEKAAELYRVLCGLAEKSALDLAASSSTSAPESCGGCQRLTPRERQVAALLADCKTDNEIAAELHIRRNTARSYATQVLAKLGVHSRRHVRPPASA